MQGERGVKAMRDYIEIREKVLFRCPPNVLNATAAPLEERMLTKPPLPGKGPVQSRPAVDRRSSPVPLPTPLNVIRAVHQSRPWPSSAGPPAR